LRLAVVMDPASRRIAGRSVSERIQSDRVFTAPQALVDRESHSGTRRIRTHVRIDWCTSKRGRVNGVVESFMERPTAQRLTSAIRRRPHHPENRSC
jgi:transposase InsO family protein